MKLAHELGTGLWVPHDPSLVTVLERLEKLALAPEFGEEREVAFGVVLRPYLDPRMALPIKPLEHEVELARLYLFSDYYPRNGQFSLIEQLRDTITEHIPQEERVWLDPLKHSFMDLLQVQLQEGDGHAGRLRCVSLGDRRSYWVHAGDWSQGLEPGQVLLTRVVHDPACTSEEQVCVLGAVLVLSSADGATVLDKAHEWRRETEVSSGSFALGEWQEFTKRYGHILLWQFAYLRAAALAEAVHDIRYTTVDGQPFLYGVALYAHHQPRTIAQGLSDWAEWQAEPSVDAAHGPASSLVHSWVSRHPGAEDATVVGRLTVTPTQLIVECENREQLDAAKHRLAETFGFLLRFRGESMNPPRRTVTNQDLHQEAPMRLVITPEEDRALLKAFLDAAYLDWADQPEPALEGQTPRYAVLKGGARAQVVALIDQMEREDLGTRRTGRQAFDYNVLRAHVGAEETPR